DRRPAAHAMLRRRRHAVSESPPRLPRSDFPAPCMKELILLRHAHAEPAAPGGADIDRALSPEGLAEAESGGRWLQEQALVPDPVLCSPARRARETLEGVLGAIGYVDQR